MSRQREIPSVQYRTANLINLTLPEMPGVPKIRVTGAARLNDAYGNVAGVGGGGGITMFEVQSGATYLSRSVRARKLPAVEETNRGLTRMVFDPDDFATPAAAAGTSYLPTDDQTLFLRVETWNPATSGWNPPGPILIVPPYDFFSTRNPVLTVTAKAPDLGIAAFPAEVPDFLPPTVMNFMAPSHVGTISVANLDAAEVLFLTLHPGVPPTVILAQNDLSLTGAGAPEFFIGAAASNPWFTIRVALVNSA